MKRINIDFKYTNTKYLMDFDTNYYTQNLLYEHFVRREICDPPMVETILDCRGSHFQYVSRERTFWFSEKNPYVRVPAAILKFCYKML